MNLTDFDRWSIELKSTAESVHASVQLNLPEISLLLDRTGRLAGAPDHQSAAYNQFSNITQKIQGAMAAHDKVLMSLG